MDQPLKGFEIPNHTQTPNSFFDIVMPQLKSIAELKVILAITRLTFGWQKRADRISMSQLRKVTGLTHQGVQNGIDLAIEHGFIERQPSGQAFIYCLKLVNEIDQSSKLTSQVNRLVNEIDWSANLLSVNDIPPTSLPNRLVNEIDTPKKGKRKERDPHRDELFEALASVCRIDWKLCTAQQRGALNQSVKVLRDAGRTPHEVRQVGEWWFAYDWRGRKGEAPKPSQIREVWAQAFSPVRNLDEHPNAHRPGKVIW